MEEIVKAPKFLEDLLLKQYGEELKTKIIEGYSLKRITSFRVNTLKASDQDVLEELKSTATRLIHSDQNVNWRIAESEKKIAETTAKHTQIAEKTTKNDKRNKKRNEHYRKRRRKI